MGGYSNPSLVDSKSRRKDVRVRRFSVGFRPYRFVEEEDVTGSKDLRSGVSWLERVLDSGGGDDVPEGSISS
jgi:hypothetical protein